MFCTTECWDCNDRTCEHYISKTELYFENENNKKEIERLQDQLQQKENIIKEVREKLNNYTTRMEVLNYQISDLTKKELLEILDKEP